MHHCIRRFARMLPLALAVCVLAAPAAANHLDELIFFDQTGADKKLDEGLVRQRLGLLNADGKPTLPLVPLVSPDGRRAAYDMNGAAMNGTFDGRLHELRNDGGILTLITHGNTGVIVMERALVKGFGAGTGSNDACAGAPVPVTTVRTNVVVNMAVCKGGDGGGGVTSVATSLRTAIQTAGGSVASTVSSANNVEVRANLRLRIRDGYEPTAAEAMAAIAAYNAFVLDGRAMADQYRDYQAALDAAVAPDVNGSKIIAVIRYSAVIDATTLQKPTPSASGDSLEDLDRVVIDQTCEGPCGTVAVEPSSWSGVKELYR